MPSSGGVSPSASSTELGRQGRLDDASFNKTAEQIQKEKDDRARWADVESDHEDEKYIVFNGEHRSAARNDSGAGWGTVGQKKGKGGRQPPPKPFKATKADPPPSAHRAVEAHDAHRKQPDYTAKTASVAYTPSRHERTKERDYGHYSHSWEDSSWGASSKGGGAWSSSATRGGSGWDEGGWGHRTEARSKNDFFRDKSNDRPKNDFFRKDRNESFKHGPQVSVNMDRSRLAW